jgi:hypothetical protein
MGLKDTRSPSLFVFHEVLNSSFGTALEVLLGRGVRDEVYRILESKGIRKDDVPSRFDRVIEVLLHVFGECSRVIIHRVLRVLYEQYSLPVDFSCQEILLDRLIVLRDRIVVESLRPRGLSDPNL